MSQLPMSERERLVRGSTRRTGTGDHLELNMRDPLGRDSTHPNIAKMREDNPTPYADATCRSTERLSPAPSKAAKCGMGWFEVIVFCVTLGFTIVALLELNGDVDYGIEKWRIFFGSVALIFGFWLFVVLLAGSFNWYNEYVAAEKKKAAEKSILDTETSESKGMPIIPPTRWGMTFVAAFASGYFVIWLYTWRMIEDDGVTVLTDESIRRRFRWKVWQFVFTSVLYLSLEIVDWFQMSEVMMNWVNSVKPCNENNKLDELEKSDFWFGLIALWNTARVIIFLASFGLAVLIGAQLYTRSDSYRWDVENMRLCIGTVAGVMLGMWFLLILALIAAYMHPKAEQLKCLRRYIWRAFWFLAVVAWSLGALWYLMYKFVDEGRQTLLTEDNRRRYDNYLWWSFIVIVDMFVNVYFQDARCMLNGGIRKAFCKYCHDF
jgi:hypothetical protein